MIEDLSKHFAYRLQNENWILHDKKRNIVSIYNTKKYIITSADNINLANIINREDEEDYQKLWKSFWNKIAIQERKNPRLQKSFMPRRYWKYLTELYD